MYLKTKLLYVFFFFSFFTFSQVRELKIQIRDLVTDEPIEDVTVTILKAGKSFLSNENGEVSLIIIKKRNIEFSHSLFKSVILNSDDLKDELNIVYLDSRVQQLEEVIITNIHPQEILKELIKNSKQKLTIPANLKIYLREFYKRNNQFVFYNDGLINFQVFGDAKKIETDILVEQNRRVGFLDKDLSDEVLGYNLNNIIENYYQFKYLDEILSSKAKKQYDFQVKTYPQNENYLVIKANPINEADGLLSNFSVLYDATNKIIIEVSAYLSKTRVLLLEENESNKIHKLEFKNTFHFEDNDYYLTSSKEVIGFYKKYKKEKRKIEVKNNIVVTNFDRKMFEYSKENVFKDKSLINKKSTIFTEYWEFDSGLTPTSEEQKIIESLAEAKDSID